MFKKEDTVYLSNKMTDLEDNGSYWFNVKEALLRFKYGCNVINPVIHTPPGLTYNQYMIIDEGLIKASTHVYMGSLWTDSPGAIQEREWAYEYSKIIIYENDSK